MKPTHCKRKKKEDKKVSCESQFYNGESQQLSPLKTPHDA